MITLFNKVNIIISELLSEIARYFNININQIQDISSVGRLA